MTLKQTGELAPVDKPWQLIRDAVHDLTLQEQTPCYKINMWAWHHTDKEGVCHQCLAGAVMSRRLGVDHGILKLPAQFPGDVASRLFALNEFREGNVFDACTGCLGLNDEGLQRYRLITPYEDDPEQFKADMLELANYLEDHYTQHED